MSWGEPALVTSAMKASNIFFWYTFLISVVRVKELFVGRSLVGAVTVGDWFEPARGAALGAGGGLFLLPPAP